MKHMAADDWIDLLASAMAHRRAPRNMNAHIVNMHARAPKSLGCQLVTSTTRQNKSLFTSRQDPVP